VSNIRDVQMLK